MNKHLVGLISLSLSMSLYGMVSQPIVLDMRNNPRMSDGIEVLNFDGRWFGDAATTSRITLNGELFAEATGRGEVAWKDRQHGLYVFTNWVVSASGSLSEPMVASFVLSSGRVAMPEFTVEDGMTFSTHSYVVGISCETEDVQIFYTLDGSTPTRASLPYKDGIIVEGATVLKAFAVRDDYIDSAVATVRINKAWTLSDVLNVPELSVSSIGAGEWVPDFDASHDGIVSLRSGTISDGESESLVMTLNGAGDFSFWWKASCESDPGLHDYDCGIFIVDGKELSRIDGRGGWVKFDIHLDYADRHELKWTYKKDSIAKDGDDCIWVDDVKWCPDVVSPITYANLHGATHANPETYQEGTVVAFTPPSGRTGYTFTGWTPAAITADMTGAQTVTAGWRANAYQIAYYANGGSGTMTATDCEYDAEGEIAANGFTRSGYVFKGWATEENGVVVYQPGDKVTNLTSNDSGVVKLYAVWEAENVLDPVITPSDGSVFKTASCTVTIACATEGAEIYYTTNGRTPRIADANRYTGPFTITDTATIVAVAVKGEKLSEYVEATITKVIPEPLTLVGALDEAKLADVTTGGDAEWLPIEDATAKVGGSCAVSGALDESDEELRETWLEAKVYGKGTLTFWWRVSCEPDPRGRYSYDFAAFEADGDVVVRKDGESDWMQVTKTFTTDGEHVIRWIYNTDGWPSDDYDGCVWVDGVTWSGSAAPEEQTKPTIEGDEEATVTGDAETGFVIKPSEGKTAVEVSIPVGIDAERVTVEVSPKVASVKPNGAKVKVVSGGADITEYLDIPGTTRSDDGGVVATQETIDLTKAVVKEEIVREALDVEKGAVIDLSGGALGTTGPTITTAPTCIGLTYTFREGTTLEGFGLKMPSATKDGDGKPWSPMINVKGGSSAFYSIGVGMPEK